MIGFIIKAARAGDDAAIEHMNNITREWTARAARGECAWICADCSMSFAEGMPDACAHGHAGCTDIFQRDKRAAQQQPEVGRE